MDGAPGDLFVKDGLRLLVSIGGKSASEVGPGKRRLAESLAKQLGNMDRHGAVPEPLLLATVPGIGPEHVRRNLTAKNVQKLFNRGLAKGSG